VLFYALPRRPRQTMILTALWIAVSGALSVSFVLPRDFGGASPVAAQVSPYVTLKDPAYRDLDVLVAHRLVGELLHAHRPYSRLTFARAVREAREKAEGSEGRLSVRVLEALDRLEGRFSEELARLGCTAPSEGGNDACTTTRREARLRLATLDLTGADSPTRDAREPQPGQRNDAVLNPLLQRNYGRQLYDGFTVSSEAEVDVYLLPNLAGQVSPRLRGSFDYPPGTEAVGATLSTAYVRTLWGKTFFDVGRTETLSGMTPDLSPLLSTNPRAITMIRVGNEHPTRLPWIFGWLGPTSLRFAVGSMGNERANPGSTLTTIEASFRPHPNFEFGGALLSEQGGKNVPELEWWERVVDTFGFILYRRPFQWFDDDKSSTNKLLGVNARLQLPSTPIFIFTEFATEDDHNIFDFGNQGYWVNAAWVWGAEARGIGPGGRLDVRLAAMHNGPIMNSHGTLVSGLTLEGRTLGSPLGPSGSGGDLQAEWVGTDQVFKFTGALERYSGDDFRGRPHPVGGRVRIANNPDELRARATLEWIRGGLDSGFQTAIRVGAEQVTRWAYTDSDRTNVLGELGVRYRW